LQEPDKLLLDISNNLKSIIKNKVLSSGGHIPFSLYMELALYHPQYGYYTSTLPKFGKSGDFVTAPEIGNLFAKCLSKEIVNIFTNIKTHNILEIGAGTGKLAADLIDAVHELNISIDKYIILEKSCSLRKIQQKNLSKFEHTSTKVIWIDELPPDNTFVGIILANEVLDALAVTCFSINNGIEPTIQERCVAYDLETDNFYFTNTPASHKLISAIDALGINANPIDYIYTSEINLLSESFIKKLAQTLNSGIILLCDYGFLSHEYYHNTRNGGTIMCHYQHFAHTDPFIYPGLQDITAHVDFSAIQVIAQQNSLDCLAMTNLAWFLINCGLADLLATNDSLVNINKIKLHTEANTLTSPAEMGEIFKVLCLGKNYNGHLLGFTDGKSFLI
jgi:SAM-dependent MidA family methyltransferase